MRYLKFLYGICCLILVTQKSQAQSVSQVFPQSNTPHNVLNHMPDELMPVIGAWFWGEDEFMADGYKFFLDHAKNNSCYDLISTAIRVPGRDITDIDVHNQVKMAAEYAKKSGLRIALELDPRVARRKFEEAYPDELQESLWLHEVNLSKNESVKVIARSNILSDHMTGRKTKYIPLRGSLQRVYSYSKTTEGIDPNSLRDITKECSVLILSKDSVVVHIPANRQSGQQQACVMASFTYLAPDVFAPHLIEFQRMIIRNYSDVPLAGGMRDEWGFPPNFTRDKAIENQFWYSKHYASAYAGKTGGRELLADLLLMYMGIKGQECERLMAINYYMEMNRQRNAALENDFYQTVKEVFGPEAAVVTHATWYPYPDRREYKKNGLDWWVAKRDWAQTDELTPFAVRTALSKKWDSPVWYNQYYATNRKSYEHELWSSALAGGRLNYHPLYPGKDKRSVGYIELLRGNMMLGQSRIRLLNYISKDPLDCPVAVIFGHPSAMNWAGPYFEDLGMDLVDSLWSMGIPTDLIPTSEIENGSLLVDENGCVHYGKQRYAAVILYNPEFEKRSTAEFFDQASKGQTKLFRKGSWSMDFKGNPFDGNTALPKTMVVSDNIESIISEVSKVLKKQKITLQTPASRRLEGFGHVSMAPPTNGFCRLIDGTFIRLAGANDAAGDTIKSRMKVCKFDVAFDAIGVAAIRLDENGEVQALAAGGLKFFKTGNFVIQLDKRFDLAFWKSDDGEFEGVTQGLEGEIPQQLKDITKNWINIDLPVPIKE